jgi:hypothetical protein
MTDNLTWETYLRWQDVCMVCYKYSESSVALRYFVSLLYGMSDEHCAGIYVIDSKTKCICQHRP